MPDMGSSPRVSESDGLSKDNVRLAEKAAENEEVDPASYAPPDGGVGAWLVILGTTLVSFATFGFVNGYGGFSDFYNTDYLSNYSPTVISMVGALQVFILYIFAGFAGAVFDALGPKYLIPTSGVIVTLSLFMLSITKPQRIYQQFLTQAVLFSLGATFAFFPCIALIPHWFRAKMAYAVGFLTAGASVGGIVFPIMMSRVTPIIGFGWTIRIFAFMVLFCYIVGTLTIKARRPTKPFPPLSRLFDFTAFKDPCYVFLALGGWFSVFSIFNPFFYVGLSGTVANPGSSINGTYLSILCATSIIGRVGPSIIADRIGRFNIMCISTLLCAVLIMAVWYTSFHESNLIAFAALYGFISGPFFSLMPSCVATISPIDRVGARIGGTYAFMAPATLIGTPLGGLFIRTRTEENFSHLILFSGIMAFIGTALMFVSRFIRDKRIFAIV
ncbi:hypothetical protein D9758_005638 [Tetrapyrgos nigripes]|uniref:Major facilitator superfamily (MFS) profile domain-containing protein n=1 Tax=Tetrapyrgos nigripes TaxID=182062 RepID=A0A8H5GGK7_9AGAR|nr:hypothetical protein D9758_005638 [Tetrapyrgos nigripes]